MREDRYLILLDVDWAPDFVIQHVKLILQTLGHKATWFVTHASDALPSTHEDQFELGIHPNFLPGSTHGETASEAIEQCMELVPNAVSMRTHGNVFSAELIRSAAWNDIQIDASLYMPGIVLPKPFPIEFHGDRLFRLPVYWEDSFELWSDHPCWEPQQLLWNTNRGLKAFAFHPVHIHMNNSKSDDYAEVREGIQDRTELPRQPGRGSGWAFEQLLHRIRPEQTYLVRDLI